ncbi:MAG: hypothetical protein AB8B59_09400 [Maribacter sp.]
MTRLLITFIAFCLAFQSCSSDNLDDNQDTQDPISVYQGSITIDDEIRPYINRFIDEMNERGLRLSTNRLSAELVNHSPLTHTDKPCGMGYWDYGISGDPRVEIQNTVSCWDRWSEIEKENLLFHELGHALLSKRHNNNTMPNGSMQSLMCGDGACNNYRVYNVYQNEQRAYYLDQLANNRIAVPDWASEKTFSRMLDEDSFDNGIEGWTTKIAQHLSFTADPNNEIHYDFYVDDKSPLSQQNALAIKTISHSSTTKFAGWQKTFSISDFENCSNIEIRADIITENLTEGSAGIIIQLLQKNTDDKSDIFANYSNPTQENGMGIINNENFEAQIVCLPKETAAIRILLYLYDARESPVESMTATFDNLEIELHE